MVDMANQKWKTAAHKKVAVRLLILNKRVVTRQQLIEHGAAINSLSSKEVRLLTWSGAMALGIPVN